jgi:hypothetical protein
MHLEVLPHPASSPNLASSDYFHLFGSLKDVLQGKSSRADDEVKFLCKDGWRSNHKPF